IWVQRSHRTPHAEGGSREAENLDLLCDYHHVLYERGELRITGPPDAPVLADREGRPLGRRAPYPSRGTPRRRSKTPSAPGDGQARPLRERAGDLPSTPPDADGRAVAPIDGVADSGNGGRGGDGT